MHCRLTLNSGRPIILRSLQQWMTYIGSLEGLPSRTSNDELVAHDVKQAQSQCIEGTRPHLLPPPRRDFLRKPGDMDDWSQLRARKVEWLPDVTCIATFGSDSPATDLS